MSKLLFRIVVAAGGAAALMVATTAMAATRTLVPVADNTLIQTIDNSFPRSNGQGDSIYTGLTQRDGLRRAVLRFDLSAIPPGAVVQSATLTLSLTNTRPSEASVALHRALQGWGEGASFSGGGIGADAEPGDATWFERRRGALPAEFWASLGGSFAPVASASVTVLPVAGQASNWSGPGVTADVQGWVDDPASNHGWFVINEPSADAKSFASREYPTALGDRRPSLSVTWVQAPPAQADGDVPLPAWALLALGAGLAAALAGRGGRRPPSAG